MSIFGVVVPVLNDEENLALCLEALVRARGARTFEILVVDDGSSDASPAVAARWGATLLQNDGHGQSRARNLGASRLATEYVWFIDSDVVVPEDCLTKIDAYLRQPRPEEEIGLQGVFSPQHPFPEWSSQIYNTLQHLLSRSPTRSVSLNASCLILRKSAFDALGGFAEDLWFMEDNELGARMAARGWSLRRGTLCFVHRKRVSWSWLFRTHLLGGKMLSVLARRKMVCRDRRPAGGIGAAPNRTFTRFLASGMLLGTGALALFGSFGPWPLGAGLLVFGIGLSASEALVLCKANRHPGFLLVGYFCLLLLPWLVVLGRVLGWRTKPSAVERSGWLGRKNPTLD